MKNQHTNCPNCGAVIVPGEFKCSYCGTVYSACKMQHPTESEGMKWKN